MSLTPWMIADVVKRALAEDVGRGDMTTEATVARGIQSEATILAKQSGVIAGLPVVRSVFHTVDPTLRIVASVSDGQLVTDNTPLMHVEGDAASILTAERIALNFIQRLSGIATATRQAVDAVGELPTVIVDTRKTTPGLRALEKYAVRMGGGKNHRFGLDDAVMIKDNHIIAAGGISEAVQSAQAHVGPMHKIEVETTNLDEVAQALAAGADVIMLDNMDVPTMKKAVATIAGRALVEASGGLRLSDVRAVAETGVDIISLGWITHSAPALDISLVLARPSNTASP